MAELPAILEPLFNRLVLKSDKNYIVCKAYTLRIHGQHPTKGGTVVAAKVRSPLRPQPLASLRAYAAGIFKKSLDH